jgi:hypothetical protein
MEIIRGRKSRATVLLTSREKTTWKEQHHSAQTDKYEKQVSRDTVSL